VNERDTGSLQPVDQVRGLSRRRDLGAGLFPTCGEWLPSACKMARAAGRGRIWSSRTYRFTGRSGLEPVALV
jgi:hypothetical protein